MMMMRLMVNIGIHSIGLVAGFTTDVQPGELGPSHPPWQNLGRPGAKTNCQVSAWFLWIENQPSDIVLLMIWYGNRYHIWPGYGCFSTARYNQVMSTTAGLKTKIAGWVCCSHHSNDLKILTIAELAGCGCGVLALRCFLRLLLIRAKAVDVPWHNSI